MPVRSLPGQLAANDSKSPPGNSYQPAKDFISWPKAENSFCLQHILSIYLFILYLLHDLAFEEFRFPSMNSSEQQFEKALHWFCRLSYNHLLWSGLGREARAPNSAARPYNHLWHFPGSEDRWEGCCSTKQILTCVCHGSLTYSTLPQQVFTLLYKGTSLLHLIFPYLFLLHVLPLLTDEYNSLWCFWLTKWWHKEFCSPLPSQTMSFYSGTSPRWSACTWMFLSTEQLGTAYKGAGFSTQRAILSHLFWTAVRQTAKSEPYLCLSFWKIVSNRAGPGNTCRQFGVPMLKPAVCESCSYLEIQRRNF